MGCSQSTQTDRNYLELILKLSQEESSRLKMKRVGSATDKDVLERRQRVIRGDFFNSAEDIRRTDNSLNLRWAAPLWKLKVFVSSTFTDTNPERKVLLEDILLVLQQLARQFEIEVTFADLRYGAWAQDTDANKTWESCCQELMRCKRESLGLFFMSLQGDKYGFQFGPRYVAKDIFEHRLTTFGDKTREYTEVLKEWYALDENMVPPTYCHKESHKGTEYWSVVLPIIRAAFDGMDLNDNFSNCNELTIGQSLTEWETRAALCDAKQVHRCMWFVRRFKGEFTHEKDTRAFYCDTMGKPDILEKLNNLKAYMNEYLAPLRMSASSLIGNPILGRNVDIDSIFSLNDNWKRYLSEFRNDTNDRLIAELTTIIEKKENWDLNGLGLSMAGQVVEEILHHCKLAAKKCFDFYGREELLATVMQRIHGTTKKERKKNRYGVAVYLSGGSGTGKTAVMSKLAQLTYASEQSKPLIDRRPVIIRLCGTSESSTYALKMLLSICKQIHHINGTGEMDFDLDGFADNYAQVVKYFHSLLRENPFVLFLDSVDRLTDDHLARSRLSFLDGIRPHKRTRIILSTLPDEKGATTGKWIYFYGCSSRLNEAKVRFVDVPALTTSINEAQTILASLLSRKGKVLNPSQWEIVMKNVSLEPTALYLRMALRVVESWRSFTPKDHLILAGSVRGIINQIFDTFELEYGKVVVRAVFGFLTFSKSGINDIEMQDLLSLDEEVLDIVMNAYSELKTPRFPFHVWLRVRNALDGLVVERENGKLTWYHRQLKETAMMRYSPRHKVKYHKYMATYFGNLLPEPLIVEKSISKQPLSLNSIPVWYATSKVNKPRCIEAGYHMVECSMIEEAAAELCNFEVICGSIKVGEGYNHINKLVSFLALLNKRSALYPELKNKVDHYIRWLSLSMRKIITCPSIEIFNTCTANQPLISEARRDAEAFLEASTVSCSVSQNREVSKGDSISRELERRDYKELFKVPAGVWTPNSCWYRCRAVGGKRIFDTMLLNLPGHTSYVSCVAFSPDGAVVCSGSSDSTIRLWDAVTGAEVTALDGHGGFVYSVSFNHDGNKVASGSDDSSIRIWDTATGAEEKQLLGHVGTVMSVFYSRCGSRLVSGGTDKFVRIWDAINETTPVLTLMGHAETVMAVAFGVDLSIAASASADTNVKVWNAISGMCLFTLTSHCFCVTSLAFTEDGCRLASGSYDKTIKIWNVMNGSLELEMTGHTDSIMSVAFAKGGHFIASGSEDCSIRVWSAKSGQQVGILEGHTGAVYSCCYNADDSRICSGSYDKTAKLWDVQFGALEDAVELLGANDSVTSVCFSANGKFIASGHWENNAVRIWSSSTCSLIVEYRGKSLSDTVHAVAFSADSSRLVVGSSDCLLRLYALQDGNWSRDPIELAVMEGHVDSVLSVAFSPNGSSIVSGSEDKTVRLWGIINISSSRVVAQTQILRGHTDYVNSVQYNSTGTRLASGSEDKTIRVWDTTTGVLLMTLRGHLGSVNCVHFAPDGSKLISASRDMTVKVWDSTNGTQLMCLDGHDNSNGTDSVMACAFSPDGTRVVTANADHSITIWEAASGLAIVTLVGHADTVRSVAFSPDAKTIVTGSKDSTIKLWDVVEGKEATHHHEYGAYQSWAAKSGNTSGFLSTPASSRNILNMSLSELNL